MEKELEQELSSRSKKRFKNAEDSKQIVEESKVKSPVISEKQVTVSIAPASKAIKKETSPKKSTPKKT